MSRLPEPHEHYRLIPQEGGLVDVYLYTGTDVRLVRGIVPWDGIEDDIRARFSAWCADGEVIL